ncbi:hypothetical protein FOZ60_006779 [Perkinsus olseni]|uniref:Ribonuclease H2 subunit B n=1 Tax=Perkinsus olseni TaxID=32597 RepID=A0A7J6NN43_PEROL|nr:hypothetical protein FOZ60_006779 [Perkinsus olseni]
MEVPPSFSRIDLTQEKVEVLRLPHPSDGKLANFLLTSAGRLFEVNSFERSGYNRGSIFVGDETLVRDPHVLLGTEVAPVMVLLPYLASQKGNQDRFVTFTDVILGASTEYSDCRDAFKHMVTLCRDGLEKQLACVCETKAVSKDVEEKVYRFSLDRLAAWLAVIVRKTSEQAISSGLYFTEVGECATEDLRRERLSRFMCELCYHFAMGDADLVAKVARRLDVDVSQPLVPSPVKKVSPPAVETAPVNQKRIRPSEANKVDAKRARLEQAAKGCKKISSFLHEASKQEQQQVAFL